MADKKTSLSKQDIILLRYFWEKHGELQDIWTDWERVKPLVEKELPEVIHCLNNYRNSIKTMDRLIKNIDEYDYPDEYEDIN